MDMFKNSQRENSFSRAKMKAKFILTAIIVIINLLATQGIGKLLRCADNCKSCWGPRYNQCMSCELGYFMSDYQCYSNDSEIDSCKDGYALDHRDMLCKRTITDIDNPCPPSTFGQLKGSQQIEQCKNCAAGQSCEAYGLSQSSSDCLAGFYCKQSAKTRSPVAALYNSFVGQALVIDIPDNGVCQTGHICSRASKQMHPCPPGHFCPDLFMKKVEDYHKCQEGFYCSSGASSATPGNPFYLSVMQKYPTGDICQAGHYCQAGSIKQLPCPPGYFMPFQMAKNKTDCLGCPYGKYCPKIGVISVEGLDCEDGYFCQITSISPKAQVCGYDQICAKGTPYPVKCLPEDYTNSLTATECLRCPDGKLCKKGIIASCENGSYCKNNTISICPPGKYGYNLSENRSTENSTCIKCGAGYTCMQQQGLKRFICAEGFQCGVGNANPRPNGLESQNGIICEPGTLCKKGEAKIDCRRGSYCPNWGASRPGGRCWEGHFCPKGSAYPNQRKCPAGHYCPEEEIDPVKCPVGTYNEGLGAISQKDCQKCLDGVICPDQGLSVKPVVIEEDIDEQCFSNSFTQQYVKDKSCARVVYCPKGSYCLTSSIGREIIKCEAGYACPGTRAPISCEAGTYQNLVGQESCKICGSSRQFQGLVCDVQNSKQDGNICPKGRYCPPGTKHSDEFPCPAGSFSSKEGLNDQSQCELCTPGYYCQFKGQQTASTLLMARYHGNGQSGWTIPNPHLCPQTAYCEEGSADSITPCPNGKWTPSIGAESIDDCITCPRGFFCRFEDMFLDKYFIEWKRNKPSFTFEDLETDFDNLHQYYGPCKSGFICLEGSANAIPQNLNEGFECSIGHYCPDGARVELHCPPGYINPIKRQSQCQGCGPRTFCPEFGMTEGYKCTDGSFCPGTDGFFPGNAKFVQISPTPCPAGTNGSPVGSISVQDCKACPTGKYCDQAGHVTPSGNCDKGFICLEGNDRPGPYLAIFNNTNSGKCPIGYKCDSGEVEPIICPPTSYNNAVQSSECINCPPGNFCIGGTLDFSQKCDAGYFCDGSSDSPRQIICPKDNFCPKGSALPHLCRNGYLNRNEGSKTCMPCDHGYLCLEGQLQECPFKHYCDGDPSYPFGKLCPNGQYGDKDGCKSCPTGSFCKASTITGECAPGYICIELADSHRPIETAKKARKAYPCPLGYYCEEGALEPIKCPNGYYTFQLAAKQKSECSACKMGYYCPSSDDIPIRCPPGTYCGLQSSRPSNCPTGTYQPFYEKARLADCLQCMAGYNCFENGIGDLVQAVEKYKCPPGHYCPEGINVQPVPCPQGTYINTQSHNEIRVSKSIEDCLICPRGYFCEKATSNRYQNPCPAGYFCPSEQVVGSSNDFKVGQGFPILCFAGYYCEGSSEGTKEIEKCPKGFYCPAGTSKPIHCDEDEDFSACPMQISDCESGTYLELDQCMPCLAGYVCDKVTTQKYPIEEEDYGYICPMGHYCPEGTSTETVIKCPVGTFRNETKGQSVEDCFFCPIGSIQNKEASTQCIVCSSGSTSNQNRTSCACIGAFQYFQESTHSCMCVIGHIQPVITQDYQTTTMDLDCRPLLLPLCSEDEFVTDEMHCASKNNCKSSLYCDTSVGEYVESFEDCFCNRVFNEPDSYCDQECRFYLLQAYLTKRNTIIMEHRGESSEFQKEAYGNKILLSNNVYCPKETCPIVSQKLFKGQIVSSAEASNDFITFFKKNVMPSYTSPYAFEIPQKDNYNFSPQRNLQDSQQIHMERSILCLKPHDLVSFEVNSIHFPVYMTQSKYNTDSHYDFGEFTQLKTKLQNAKLQYSTFITSFSYEGVFAFSDNSSNEIPRTIVLVTKNKQRCYGEQQWPLTSFNMDRLQILSSRKHLLREISTLFTLTPILFILLSFALVPLNAHFEGIFEKRQQKHFEVQKDRLKFIVPFNLQGYEKPRTKQEQIKSFAQTMKTLKLTIKTLKKQIEGNEKRRQMNEQQTVDQLLQQKYINVTKNKSQKEGLKEIRQYVKRMLNNLHISDGRSLQQVIHTIKLSKKADQEEATLMAMIRKEENDQKVPSSSSDDEKSYELDSSSEEGAIVKLSRKEKKQNEECVPVMLIDKELAENTLACKANLKERTKQFVNMMDPNLLVEQRENMIKDYEENMNEIVEEMHREHQDENTKHQARLATRNKRKHKTILCLAFQRLIMKKLKEMDKKLATEQRQLKKQGIESKALVTAREDEIREAKSKLNDSRQTKMKTIKEEFEDQSIRALTQEEQQYLIQTMAQNVQMVQEQYESQKKHLDTHLSNKIIARQKRRLKTNLKNIQKRRNNLANDQQHVSSKDKESKAKQYADSGAPPEGLLTQQIVDAKEEICSSIKNNLSGPLQSTLKHDKDIQVLKYQLEQDKEHQLYVDQVEIDQQINEVFDKNRKNRIIEQESSNPKIVQAKLKMRQELLSINKMKIEANQIDILKQKELEVVQKQFDSKIEETFETLDDMSFFNVERIMSKDHDKQEALVLVNQLYDASQDIMLKALINKDFEDFTNIMGNMETKTASEHMIRVRETEIAYEKNKEEIIRKGMSQAVLEPILVQIGVQKDLEVYQSNEKMNQERENLKSQLKDSQMTRFHDEKIKLVTHMLQKKQERIQSLMERETQNKVFQKLGNKFLKLCDKTREQEIEEADQILQQEQNILRKQILSEQDKLIQDNEQKMLRQVKVEEQKYLISMKTQRDQVVAMKRFQFQERLEMDQELGQDKIHLLKKQHTQNMMNLEGAISLEQVKQFNNMKNSKINRRIQIQQQMKIQEEDNLRERLRKLKTGLSWGLRTLFTKKLQEQKDKDYVNNNDKLRARLAAWKHNVSQERTSQGGQSSLIWNLEAQRLLDIKKKDAHRKMKELTDILQVSYNSKELYLRMQRVQKYAELVHSDIQQIREERIIEQKQQQAIIIQKINSLKIQPNMTKLITKDLHWSATNIDKPKTDRNLNKGSLLLSTIDLDNEEEDNDYYQTNVNSDQSINYLKATENHNTTNDQKRDYEDSAIDMTNQNLNSFRRLLDDGDGDLTSRDLTDNFLNRLREDGKTILDERLEAKTIIEYEDEIDKFTLDIVRGEYEDEYGEEEQNIAKISIDETATLLQEISKINDSTQKTNIITMPSTKAVAAKKVTKKVAKKVAKKAPTKKAIQGRGKK